MHFGNLEIRYVLSERDLGGGFLENFQRLKDGFRIRIRKKGTYDLVVKLPELIYFSEGKEKTLEPTPFCMKVRKHVRDRKISRVCQHGLDRVAVIEFAQGNRIVLELFAKGNILLTEGGRILACLRMEKWKDRTLRPGEEYIFPKGKPDKPDFEGLLKGNDSLVKTLIKNLPLSPKYCEELCARAGYEKNMKTGEAEPKRIERAMKELLNSKYSPVKYLSGGKVVDIAPFPLKIHAELEEVPVKTLSGAVQDWDLKRDEATRRESKFERIAGKTKAGLEERLEKIREYKQAGDYIYRHYSEFEEILKNHKTDSRVKKREGRFIEVELG